LLAERGIEARPHVGDLAQPRAPAAPFAIEPQLPGAVAQLPQHELRIPDDRDVGGDVPADARRARVDLDVRRVAAPRRRLAEVLAAPEREADGEHDVGAARERLLPRAPDGERIVFGYRALAGAAGVHRDLERRRERA